MLPCVVNSHLSLSSPLQIHIKLRSTTTKDFPDTSSELEGNEPVGLAAPDFITSIFLLIGMSFDSYGYSCNALHFFGLLSDPSFADFVKEVAEVNSSYSEPTKPVPRGLKRVRIEGEGGDDPHVATTGAAAPGGEYQDHQSE